MFNDISDRVNGALHKKTRASGYKDLLTDVAWEMSQETVAIITQRIPIMQIQMNDFFLYVVL